MKNLLNFTVITFSLLASVSTAFAQELDVPIMEIADDDFETCAFGKVTGLKADGDGFLAVRTGPGTEYSKIDELKNDDQVWLYQQKGKWIGIAYATTDAPCDPIKEDRPLEVEGKKGWVHENWITVVAG